MPGTIIISIITCLCFIVLTLVKPEIKLKNRTISIYWAAPLIGALMLLCFGFISGNEIISGLTADTEINPLKILVLFLSMTMISVFLDTVGFFRYLAGSVLNKAKTNQMTLFLYLYISVSVLTVFTSNDIIVLTFTPFICYFAKNADIDPLPYLICEFIAANTWSMLLIIGNPTNIYLMTGTGISFIDYTITMLLPTVFAGITSLSLLVLLFKKKLIKPLSSCFDGYSIPNSDKPLVYMGVFVCVLCLVLMIVSSYIGLPMWIISICCFAFLFLLTAVYLIAKKRGLEILTDSLKRAPIDIVPFVLSMFVLVLTLNKAGVTTYITDFLSGKATVFRYGIASFATANVINNIPMSVLFSSVITGLSGHARLCALFAAVAGSNLGAFLTPIGALAGIMWINMLKNHGVTIKYLQFVKYGIIIAIPSMLSTILGLIIIL